MRLGAKKAVVKVVKAEQNTYICPLIYFKTQLLIKNIQSMKKIFTSLFSLFLLFGAMNAVAAEYPFKVTTDAENPELYAIKSGRGDAYWWTYTPTDGMIALAAYTYDDSQYWYFMETTEGETTYLMLYPYLGEGKAMGYTDTSAGGAKVKAVAPGTEGYDCRWIFDNNGGKAPYGLKPSSNNIYLSNYGGAQNKMGFWTTGPAGDGGTAMYFEPASKYGATLKKIATLSDLYYLQSTIGLVKNVEQFSSNAVEPKEGALANLLDNNYSTFFHSTWSQAVSEKHYLQVEVSEPVESFIFYFKKRHNNNNNRPIDMTIQGSTDGASFYDITNINSGFPTTEAVIDYTSEVITASTAYKYFRFVINATNNNGLNNGFPFFTFSEFWMFPGDQSLLDNFYDVQDMAQTALASDEESAFYGELMTVFSALADAYFAGEDYTAKKEEFEAVMAKIDQESNNKALAAAIAIADPLLAAAAEAHAETPALGQYATAVYDAFGTVVAEAKAIENATQEDVDALNEAIKNFRLAKNMPVFVIGGVIEYAKDKYIYDKSAEIPYFKDLDLADESMLWAFDMTSTEVGVKDSAVVVRNLATGNLFWNSAYIKVTETADADSIDDGQYLFFVDHQTNPVHARQSDSGITTWASNTANSGSAWKFTYVGTTYDLYDLSEGTWFDATDLYMKNADLSSTENWTAEWKTAYDANRRVMEFYAGWGSLEKEAASITQSVDLPAGTYRVSGNAFYRYGRDEFVDNSKSLGKIIAGENFSFVAPQASEGNPGYGDAEKYFYEEGKYAASVDFTLDADASVAIGYEATFEEVGSWFVIGGVKLEKKQTVKDNFLEQAMAFSMFGQSSMAMYSLGAVQEKWAEVMASIESLYGAVFAGEKILKAELEAAMELMTATMAELKPVLEYYESKFTDTKWAMYDIQDNSTANSAEVASAFEDALTATLNVSAVTTVAELEAKVAEMEAARQAYVLNAVPAENFAFDYTFKVVNAQVTSAEGWTNGTTAGGQQYEGAPDNTYLDWCNWSGSVQTVNMYQVVSELPAGMYALKAATRAHPKMTGTIYADTFSTAIHNVDNQGNELGGGWGWTTVENIIVVTGKMTIGFKTTAPENGVWAGADNFTLSYTGALPDSIYSTLKKQAFIERYNQFEALTEGLDYSWNSINNNYYFTVQEAAWAVKDTLDNVTDMSLLDAQMAAMDEAEELLAQAYAVAAEYNYFKELFFDAAGNSTPMNEEVASAAQVAIEGTYMAGYAFATIEDLAAAVVDLKAAYVAYVGGAYATEGYMFDMTFNIQNPKFDSNMDGWTTVKSGWNGGAGYDNIGGIAEIADWNATSWSASITQSLTELPNGRYVVKMAWMAATGIKMTLSANEGSVEVVGIGDQGGNIANDGSVVEMGQGFRGWQYAEVEGVVENGVLTIEVSSSSDAQHTWSNADNFELYYAGAPVEVNTVTLDQTEVTLEIAGEEFDSVQLVATVAPENAEDQTITWSSSDEAVATVDANGVVTSVAPGTATITATAANGVSATCVVTVVYAEGIESIEADENVVIYTITGKSVQGNLNSLERGIYIVNGKKVYVK